MHDDVSSYVQFHHPQGRGYEEAATLLPQPVWADRLCNGSCASAFGLKVVSDEKHGDALQFCNGEESFVVYPKFGASLQNWRRSGNVLIPDVIENFLQRDSLPGGYRSYTAAGGFRAIWAMGTHSNPCILWQHPWDWSIVEQSQDKVEVTLTLKLPSGAFAISITTERGLPGFACEARCVNYLEHAFGAFNFNLPLFFGLDDLTAMKLSWTDHDKTHDVSVAERAVGAFWIPALGALTIRCPTFALRIDPEPEQIAGYFVDWNVGFLTPDLHGAYRPLKVGQETVARWSLR